LTGIRGFLVCILSLHRRDLPASMTEWFPTLPHAPLGRHDTVSKFELQYE
jgi:hypothetical protein